MELWYGTASCIWMILKQFEEKEEIAKIIIMISNKIFINASDNKKCADTFKWWKEIYQRSKWMFNSKRWQTNKLCMCKCLGIEKNMILSPIVYLLRDASTFTMYWIMFSYMSMHTNLATNLRSYRMWYFMYKIVPPGGLSSENHRSMLSKW